MSGNALRAAAFAATVLCLLAACVSAPPRPPAPIVDAAQARELDRRRAGVGEWTISGRIAVATGKRGGSGRLDWRQRAEGYAISLSAPVTRQSWQLTGDAGGARLEGIEGGPREGADAGQLLWSATGWSIPVLALQDWVRGIGAPEPAHGEAVVAYGGDGLPTRIEQAGWTIDYPEWHPGAAGRPPLPRRIVARSGDASVRLIVDEWLLP